MMNVSEVDVLVRRGFPEAKVMVEDMTGTEDHFIIHVVSKDFDGKTLIQRHRMVQKAIQEAMDDGRIHAIQLKTETPEEAVKRASKTDGLSILE